MRWNRWLGRGMRLGMLGSAALIGAAAYANEDQTPDKEKPAPAKVEDGSGIDIRVPEKARPPGARRNEFWIGLEARPAPEALSAQLDLPEGQGLVVEQVAPDSPAAKAGFKRHDILLSVGDQPLKDLGGLIERIGESDGKELSLKVLRKGETMTISVTPSARPIPQGPEGEHQRMMARILDRVDRNNEPFLMRFFHPGVVLPPGESGHRQIPSDLTITITRQGGKPASVEVKKGDKTWKVSEDTLAELPEQVRGYVEDSLGRGPWNDVLRFRGEVPFEGEQPPRPAAPQLERPDRRVEQRLEEMNRRLEELREQVKKMHDARRNEQ